jgi:hypothetical protein
VKLGSSGLSGIVGIYELAKAGRTEDVLESIQDSENIEEGLAGACNGGHKDLVQLMIQMDATDLNWGMVKACQGGHKEIAQLMIQKMESSGAHINWDSGLWGACMGNGGELIRLMIQKGAKVCWNCNRPLYKH